MLIKIYSPTWPPKSYRCSTTTHCGGIYTVVHFINCFCVIPTPIMVPFHKKNLSICCNKKGNMFSKQLEIQDGCQYGRLLLGKLLSFYKSPNIQHRDFILVSIPTIWGINNHTDYTTLLVVWWKAELRHGQQTKFHGLREYTYFLGFLTKSQFSRF